ncbi:MAG: phosphonopyruvate decarboxylase [Candidatus Omnitrophota bacterium]
MIKPEYFYELLSEGGIDLFTGVPDSLLKDFCAYVTDHVSADRHIIAANEGGAVAIASGYYLSTGRTGLVYMQNSGQGNAINPLASLADKDVYSLPILLLIGWRGKPGEKDEPQHAKQGKVTLSLLDAMDIPYKILPRDIPGAEKCMADIFNLLAERNAPAAVIIEKGTFEPYECARQEARTSELTREDAIRLVVNTMDPAGVIVSTTGKASRELYEYREQKGMSHERDFLNVGAMGHSSQVALGVAISQPSRDVYCIDGDGAVIMHMGALAVIGEKKVKNFKHVIINNGAHDSVGGQPTAGLNMSFAGVAKACGYSLCLEARNRKEAIENMKLLRFSEGPAMLEIKTNMGSRHSLTRPALSRSESKKIFMEFLRK